MSGKSLLCAPSNTNIKYIFGEGAAGTDYAEFRATNTSNQTCHTGEYPGARLIHHRHDPIKTHVSRSLSHAPGQAKGSAHHGRFNVAAGHHFFIEFSYSPAGPCQKGLPPKARDIRITLPNNRASQVVSLPHRTNHGGPIYACHGELTAYRVFDKRA
jgi:hypothetical protein